MDVDGNVGTTSLKINAGVSRGLQCEYANVYLCRWAVWGRSGVSLCSISPEALVAYAAPKGGDMQAMTGGARFEDLSYDGVVRGSKLIDGLGQMSDSLLGPNDFELPDPLDTQGKSRF